MSLNEEQLLLLLYRSFDDPLSEKENRLLNRALEESPGLREEKRRIRAQRDALAKSSESMGFGPYFAESIVNKLKVGPGQTNNEELFFGELFTYFKRFAAVTALLCLILISYNLIIGEGVNADDVLYLSQDTYQEIMEMPLF